MNLTKFSEDLLKIYKEMDHTFSSFQAGTGLNCLNGCGKCCTNPEIEASPLEMIPLALSIFKEGKLEIWLEKLETNQKNSCLLYEATTPDGSKGKCGAYWGRPSVCRMFGVAGYFDKNHKVTLSVCRLIKEAQPELTQKMRENVSLEETPIIANWSQQLASLDPRIIQEKRPINESFYLALQRVALYAQYQEGT